MVSIVRQEAARKLHFAKRDPFHMFEAAVIEPLSDDADVQDALRDLVVTVYG